LSFSFYILIVCETFACCRRCFAGNYARKMMIAEWNGNRANGPNPKTDGFRNAVHGMRAVLSGDYSPNIPGLTDFYGFYWNFAFSCST